MNRRPARCGGLRGTSTHKNESKRTKSGARWRVSDPLATNAGKERRCVQFKDRVVGNLPPHHQTYGYKSSPQNDAFCIDQTDQITLVGGDRSRRQITKENVDGSHVRITTGPARRLGSIGIVELVPKMPTNPSFFSPLLKHPCKNTLATRSVDHNVINSNSVSR